MKHTEAEKTALLHEMTPRTSGGWRRWFSRPTGTRMDMEPTPDNREVLVTRTITYVPWFGWGEPYEDVQRFRGARSIWYWHPGGYRVEGPTGLLYELRAFWQRASWAEEGKSDEQSK